MTNHLHYEQDGNKWLWFWHSWTDGKTTSGDWYVSKYYCTDSTGDGVFFVDRDRNERKQLVGTCDFSVAGLKNPQRKIREWMKAEGRMD